MKHSAPKGAGSLLCWSGYKHSAPPEPETASSPRNPLITINFVALLRSQSLVANPALL
jgi:hypothetical protein